MSPIAAQNRGCIIRRQHDDATSTACTVAVEDIPMPVPKVGEVLIELKVVGICGSDVHYWRHGRIGDFVVGDSLVLGHEAAGVVVELGEGVTNLKVGDRVAVEPGVPCGHCSLCKVGRYNLCPDMQFWATPPYDGCLCNFAAIKAANCFLLPDNMSYEEGAMLEPFSVGLHACRRGDVKEGSNVLIIGAGPIGVMCLMAARALGAKSVTLVDPEAGRLELAKECGATQTIQVKPSTVVDLRSLMTEAPDVAMECSGSEAGIAMSLKTATTAGKVVNVGCCPCQVTVPLVQAAMREVDILGVFRYCNTWPTGIELVSKGKVDFKPLITHTFAFDKPGDVEKAFETSWQRKDELGHKAIKVMIRVSPDEEDRPKPQDVLATTCGFAVLRELWGSQVALQDMGCGLCPVPWGSQTSLHELGCDPCPGTVI